MKDLLREVPVVERLAGLESVVALQPDEGAAGGAGKCPRQTGLAHSRSALTQKGFAEAMGKHTGSRKFGCDDVPHALQLLC